MNIIEIQDATFRYASEAGVSSAGTPAVDRFSLAVRPGEFVAILGPNGSGKSTLAKLMNGILLPESGKVYIKGMDTADETKLYDIRHVCGMVFQNPDNQLVATVVEEDVAFALENMGVPPPEIRRRVDEALALVNMEEYKTHAPHLLSGGQKQRVAIAGIWAMEPECVVLDEPTAMLDPAGRREVMATIRRLNGEKGVTVILITHHMDEASLASRVVIMDGGRLLLDAPPKEVFPQVEMLNGTGLAAPDTVRLLYELKKEGFPADLGALSVEECAGEIYRLFGPQAGENPCGHKPEEHARPADGNGTR